jgi:hypothetical protein
VDRDNGAKVRFSSGVTNEGMGFVGDGGQHVAARPTYSLTEINTTTILCDWQHGEL